MGSKWCKLFMDRSFDDGTLPSNSTRTLRVSINAALSSFLSVAIFCMLPRQLFTLQCTGLFVISGMSCGANSSAAASMFRIVLAVLQCLSSNALFIAAPRQSSSSSCAFVSIRTIVR